MFMTDQQVKTLVAAAVLREYVSFRGRPMRVLDATVFGQTSTVEVTVSIGTEVFNMIVSRKMVGSELVWAWNMTRL